MKLRTLVLTGAIFAALGSTTAVAHHSNAMYERTKVVELTGTVREFQWTNPHVWVELDVQTAKGPIRYSIEGPTPSILRKKGWKFNSLKPGDKATIKMHPLKGAKNGGGLVSATVNGVTLNYEPPPAGGGR